MPGVQMSSKNRVVVPREARERLGLHPGDRLLISVRDDTIVMEKAPEDLAAALEGLLGGCFGEDLDEYLERERGSCER